MKISPPAGGVFLVFGAFALEIISGDRSNRKELNDVGLTTDEIIKKYGYPVETHKVQTEDGYILTLFRIPHGKNSTKAGFPILAAHGIVGDSSLFVLYGENSLGFFLADEGYDVWLANMRGTPYSRKHKHLSDQSSEFWDFSWHEYGVYDLPAFTDYVCGHTRNPDLLLLGYSMGSSAALVMTSERPEYSRKIRGAVLLGPVTTLKYGASLLRPIAPLLSVSQGLSKILLNGEYNIQNDVYRNLARLACNSTVLQRQLCKTAIFTIIGFDNHGFDDGALMNLMIHVQSSTSTKTIVHYAQIAISGVFRKFSYGPLGNLARYKQLLPPAYHLDSITTPMCLFVGKNDVFATVRDVETTLEGRSFVKDIYYVPRPTFSHIDFLLAKDVKEQVYYEMLRKIKYLINAGWIKK